MEDVRQTTNIMLDKSRFEHKIVQIVFPKTRQDVCQLNEGSDINTQVDTRLWVSCGGSLVAVAQIHNTDAIFVDYFESNLGNCIGMWANQTSGCLGLRLYRE